MMEKLNMLQKEALMELSKHYAKQDKFVTPLDIKSIEHIENRGKIYLTNDLEAYMIVEEIKPLSIKSIYSKEDKYDNYLDLLMKIKDRARYIAPLKSSNLNKALEACDFKIVKEHHQLVKKLKPIDESSLVNESSFKPLKEFCSKEILNLINAEISSSGYTIEEIEKQKHSKYSFAYKDLLGLGIAYVNKNGMYLEQIVVNKKYQGKKIGQKILLHLHQRASKDFDKVTLHVFKDNIRAYNLYRKLSYKLDKVIAYWEN